MKLSLSDSHFEDYWLINVPSAKEMFVQAPMYLNRSNWRYAGGGNDPKWSPDSSKIAWTTPRKLVPFHGIGVWVVHLVLLDTPTLKQHLLTSDVSYESDHFWCTSRKD